MKRLFVLFAVLAAAVMTASFSASADDWMRVYDNDTSERLTTQEDIEINGQIVNATNQSYLYAHVFPRMIAADIPETQTSKVYFLNHLNSMPITGTVTLESEIIKNGSVSYDIDIPPQNVINSRDEGYPIEFAENISEGTKVIYVTVSYPGQTYTDKWQFEISAFEPIKYNLKEGETSDLLSDDNFEMISSRPDIVKVDGFSLTGVKQGKCLVREVSKPNSTNIFGSDTAMWVTVNEKEDETEEDLFIKSDTGPVVNNKGAVKINEYGYCADDNLQSCSYEITIENTLDKNVSVRVTANASAVKGIDGGAFIYELPLGKKGTSDAVQKVRLPLNVRDSAYYDMAYPTIISVIADDGSGSKTTSTLGVNIYLTTEDHISGNKGTTLDLNQRYYGEYTWTALNESIAEIDEFGILTFKDYGHTPVCGVNHETGTMIVYVTTNNGETAAGIEDPVDSVYNDTENEYVPQDVEFPVVNTLGNGQFSDNGSGNFNIFMFLGPLAFIIITVIIVRGILKIKKEQKSRTDAVILNKSSTYTVGSGQKPPWEL